MSHIRLTVVLLLLLIGFFCRGQSFDLQGRIVNEVQEPIYFANLVLLQQKDSTFVMGTSTNEDGSYFLGAVKPGDYVLKATFIGYKSFIKALHLDSDTELPLISLKRTSQELDGVVVEKNRAILEKKTGKLVFNVSNTSLSSLSSYEILQQTPGVITVGDEIAIKNSKTTVYINDRRVYLDAGELKSFLQSYSGSNIAAVEIILHPSAKYDADGGYVLNIITNKNVSVGYKGSVEGTYKQGVFPKYGLGTNHYYKNDFLDLYVGYTLNQHKWYKEDQGYIQFFDAGQSDEFREWDLYKTTKNTSHQLNTIFDFTLDADNNLSLNANLNYDPNRDIATDVDTRTFNADDQTQVGNITLGDIENKNTYLALNATYTRQINPQNSLSLQTNYVYYQDTALQLLNTEFYNTEGTVVESRVIETDADQRNTIFTAQGDYSLNLLQERQLEFGAKFSNINSNSEMLYIGAYVPENGYDDRFNYEEQNIAAYINYNKDWEKWNLQAGMRGETTSTTGISDVSGLVNDQNYLELFPNLAIQHHLAENHQLGVYYKRGINRPRYQSLNPYRYYINEDNFVSGNPNLTRAIENRVGLEYTYKGNFIFDLYYQHIEGELNRFSFQNNQDKFLYSSYFNAEEFYQYSLDFTHYSYVTKNWFLSLYSSAYYYHIGFKAIESSNELKSLHTLGFFGQLNNWYTLSKDKSWRATLNLEYVSGYYFGNYFLNNRFKTSIGLRKTLWAGRGEINLNLSDVFNTANVPVSIDYLNQYNGYTAKAESRLFTLSFRYRFGNYKLKDNQREHELNEQQRLLEEKEL